MKCMLMDMMEKELEKQGTIARAEQQRRLNPAREKADHSSAAAAVISEIEKPVEAAPPKEMIAFDASVRHTELARKQKPRIRRVIKSDRTVAGLSNRAAKHDSNVRVGDSRPLRTRRVRMT